MKPAIVIVGNLTLLDVQFDNTDPIGYVARLRHHYSMTYAYFKKDFVSQPLNVILLLIIAHHLARSTSRGLVPVRDP